MAAPQDPADRLGEVAAQPDAVPYLDNTDGSIKIYRQAQLEDPVQLQRIAANGLVRATPKDVENRQRYLKNTTLGGQAKAAGKLAANVATFGAAGFDSAEDKAQIKDFREASPTLSALSEVAGTVPLMAVGGVLAPEAMAAAGLSGRAAQIGAAVADEVGQSTAIANEHATEQSRGISLAEVLQGLPLAVGLSAVGRLARGGARTVPESLLESSEAEGNILSRARATSAERRSAGAAAAKDEGQRILSDEEVRHYAGNRDEIHAQVEQAAGDAIEDASGGTTPAFDEVHNIGLKKADVAGKMEDASPELMDQFQAKHTEAIEGLAESLDAQGQKNAARALRTHVAAMEGAEDAEDLAIASDQAKRTLDRYRTRFGAAATKATDPLREHVQAIDEVLEPLRRDLEDSETWGKMWSEKQAGENKLWSGDDGIIRSGSVWQHEFLERLPGAAGNARRGLNDVPVFKARGDIVKHALAMPKRDFELTTAAWSKWIDNVEQMSLLKTELGVQSVETTPVMRLQQSLNDMKSVIEELKTVRQAEQRGQAIVQKNAVKASAQGFGEHAFDVAAELPGVGHTVRAADRVAEALSGKSLRDRLFKAKVAAPVPEFTREGALKAIRGRQGALSKPGARAAGADVQSYVPKEPGAGGGLGLAAQLAGLGARSTARTAVTDSLAEISDHSRAISERAGLGLVAPDSRPTKLPPLASRFKGGAPDLNTAFQNKLDDLRKVDSDPQAFLDGMTDTFGTLAKGGHSDLYTRVIARVQIGAQYMLANAPPSVGISMTRPDGIPPDSIAIMKWAAMHDAVFNPGNVVYDVGTGDATPTQIKALREVHPDIYGQLRANVMKQIAQAGQSIPFETLRTLDNLFDVPGVAGPAFSAGMTATMAQAYATKTPQSSPSLKGESALTAPTSAVAQFAHGPSQLG